MLRGYAVAAQPTVCVGAGFALKFVLVGAEWPAPAATDAAAVCCLYITSLRHAFLCWCGFFHIPHVSGPDWPERHS